MSEKTAGLREKIIDEFLKAHELGRESWDSQPASSQCREVANTGMGRDFGHIRDSRDPENPYREHDTQTLRLIAENRGFPTIEEYTVALVELREELRSQLSPKDWEIFFGSTTDIT